MGKRFIIPDTYNPMLDLKQTETAIKLVKDTFQFELASELRLRRVTAPLFVSKNTGINDDLNGVERKVSFTIKDMDHETAEVVNSLAKWKRLALADYEIETDTGIYTDMNAVRPDEELDNIHSLYVDQWDWEHAINKESRNLDFLKLFVRKIYEVFKKTEFILYEHYPQLKPFLPKEITFLHSEDLYEMYPEHSPGERENKAAQKYGAIFVIGIGGEMQNGEPHDGRAPDYDDWITETKPGYKGLNGDIIFWNPILQSAFEISSMGIRVDRDALSRQLSITNTEERKKYYFHQRLLNDDLPFSIGGGIGQSRLCMFFLKKAHIGEVQSSIWPTEMIETCKQNNIYLM